MVEIISSRNVTGQSNFLIRRVQRLMNQRVRVVNHCTVLTVLLYIRFLARLAFIPLHFIRDSVQLLTLYCPTPRVPYHTV